MDIALNVTLGFGWLVLVVKFMLKWATKKLAIHCVVSDRLSMMPGPRNPTRSRGRLRHRLNWGWIGFRRRLLPDQVSECVDSIRRRGRWLTMNKSDRHIYFDHEFTRTERVWPHSCDNPRLHKQIHKRARYLLLRQGFNITPKRHNGSPAYHRRRSDRMKQIADNMAVRRESQHVRAA